LSSPSPPPSTCSTAYPTVSRRQQQRDSVLSQQSSLYPPSTVTSASAFSGPETPPEHSLDLPLLDVDDVSYRLKLLVKNNYFLPPPHLKPTQHQLSALPATPLKSPTLRTLFRPSKSPKTPQPPPIPQVPVFKPRNTRPQNRVVVIRETLPELVPEPLPLSEEYTGQLETFVDPTNDVDSASPVVNPAPRPTSSANGHQQPQGDWRRDLLAQAVGLSLFSSQFDVGATPNPRPEVASPVDPPPRKQSLPSGSQPPSLGQPISAGVANIPMREFKVSKPLETPTSALKPPPRPPRDRARRGEDSPTASDSPAPNESAQSYSTPATIHEREMVETEPRNPSTLVLIRPSFAESPRPSFSQSPPHSPGSFGHLVSPPRFSGATDQTQSTTTVHFDDHDTTGRYSASRPSLSASSMHSEPRPSMAESRVSHYSTTFGDRARDSKRQSRASGRSSDATAPNSRRSSLAYLRDTRSRSLSPSRATFSPPPVPPLPTSSDTEGFSTSTIIYVHPTGALSNTAIGNANVAAVSSIDSPPSALLNPKRGITNCPVSPSPPSPRFFGLKSPKGGPVNTLTAATLDIDILLNDTRPTEELHQSDSNVTVSSWHHSQLHQEAARKFDGMVVQHIESEKDRFKRIASRGKSD